MSYNMFIDDERMPVNPTDIICRNMDEVVNTVRKYGIPTFISFDHDLGENEPTGYDIAKWLAECDMDGDYQFPDNFQFYVHSQNVCGAKNIQSYLENYLEIRKET